tara:strand:- start:55 stop:471 length:417 start_codon:yes stop_codon:yes gene_type:complete
MSENERQTIISKVTKTSPYGFQLESLGDSWVNYGKFYEGDKNIQAGQELIVNCTKVGDKYYVNQIDQGGKENPDKAVQYLANDRDTLEIQRDPKQRLIVAQTALKAASELCSDVASTKKAMADLYNEVWRLAESEPGE